MLSNKLRTYSPEIECRVFLRIFNPENKLYQESSASTGKTVSKICQIKKIMHTVQSLLHVRYSQKETPGLFSWEFSCNQLAHRESIACNWL